MKKKDNSIIQERTRYQHCLKNAAFFPSVVIFFETGIEGFNPLMNFDSLCHYSISFLTILFLNE